MAHAVKALKGKSNEDHSQWYWLKTGWALLASRSLFGVKCRRLAPTTLEANYKPSKRHDLKGNAGVQIRTSGKVGVVAVINAAITHRKERVFARWLVATVLAFVVAPNIAMAQVQTHETYAQELDKTSRASPAETSEQFGERIDYSSGSLSFGKTIVEIPGNNRLRVAVDYALSLKTGMSNQPMYYWSRELPYMEGVHSLDWGWSVGRPGDYSTQRCSHPSAATGAPVIRSTKPPINNFLNEEYWNGNSLVLPEGGGGVIRPVEPGESRPSGADIRWATNSDWRFSCYLLENGGEGFVGHKPDGTKYYFGAPVAQDEIFRIRNSFAPYNDTWVEVVSYRMYVTRVEDRFGNWVRYEDDRIISSDGRLITIEYSGNNTTFTANGRTWTVSGSTVTNPDGTVWSISTTGVFGWQGGEQVFHDTCRSTSQLPMSVGGSVDITVNTESGAKGNFRVEPRRHGYSYVPYHCYISMPVPGKGDDPKYPRDIHHIDQVSLVSKSVSGPGLTPYQETIDYGPTNACYVSAHVTTPDECQATSPTTRTVTVTRSDGFVRKLQYGNKWGDNAGLLLSENIGGVQKANYRYTTFYDSIGRQYGKRKIFYSVHEYKVAKISGVEIQQQGQTFSYVVNSFDAWARPTRVTRSSDLPSSPARTETITYHDDVARWTLGQRSRVTCVAPASPTPTGCGSGGTVISEVIYDGLARPTQSKSFGKTLQMITYNADGTVATLGDGNNNVTELANWKRGIPRTINHPATPESPSGSTKGAVVDDNGWITRVTDENGFQVNYQYDLMGRLAKVIYPAGDSVAWNDTTYGFAKATSSAYGIPAGHWQHTEATGNGRKVTYLDALWRPVLVREYDATNATGTQRFVRSIFDPAGRRVFNSYPSANSVADTGVWTEYDALGRPTSISEDSEYGLLVTQYGYLSNFRTRVTNPKLKQITTSYLAWDLPITAYPVGSAHPGGAFTDIERDIFGKPTSITRRDSSGGVSLTRGYVYDVHQQLCKSVEPETGATIRAYDGAGNLAWSKAGSSQVGMGGCNTDSVPFVDRTVRTYDSRNRLQSLTFPDNLGNTLYDYTPDGLLEQITVNNGGVDVVSTVYNYNRRRLPAGEAVVVGHHQWGIGYGYNPNAHIQVHVLPSGRLVDYAPNALGQPTQAGDHASGVSYFPNGAIEKLTYGNGIVRTYSQNMRGLPERIRDTHGSSVVFDEGLDYDQHGNVAAISDGLPGHRGDRTMAYDDLDRLIQTVSPMFGTASYSYDVLDNLQIAALTAGPKARSHSYDYGADNRLTSVINTAGGATVASFTYDEQGNLASRNAQFYQFDSGNRLRSVPGIETYVYDGHGRRVRATRNGASTYTMYGQDGVLRYQLDEKLGKTIEYVHLAGQLIAQLEEPIPLGTPILTAPSSSATGSYNVSWTSVTGADRYELEERLGSGNWSRIQNTGALSRPISGKHAGSWGYRVRACDDTGCSGWSGSAEVSVEVMPGAAPNLTVPSSNTTGSFNAAWTGVAGATRYELQERLGTGSWSQIQNTSATSHSITGKATGNWGYRVRACNSTGCSGWSSIATVNVLRAPSSAPTVTAPGSNTSGSYSVSWTSVTHASRYELQERLGTGNWSQIQNTSATSRSVTGKATGDWGYRVRACNTTGCGGWSSIAIANVLRSPDSTPTVTAPGTNTSGSYGVSWTSVTHTSRYELQERLGTGSWSQIQNTSATNRPITGKATGDWGYRVRACNAAGCGGWSSARVVGVVRPPTSAPTISAPGVAPEGNYTVSWTAVSAATRYRLEVKELGNWYEAQNTSARQLSVTNAGPATVQYRVRACNVDCGPLSSEVTVLVPAPPGFPSIQVPPAENYGSYTIKWNSGLGAAYYEVQERRDSGAWQTIYSGTTRERAFANKPVGTYSYRVQGCNQHLCSGYGPVVTTQTVLQPSPAPTLTLSPTSLFVGQTFSLSWNAVTPVTQYQLQQKTGSGAWATIYTGTARSRQITSTLGTHTFRVRGCNSSACGPYSSVRTGTAMGVPPPPPPPPCPPYPCTIEP